MTPDEWSEWRRRLTQALGALLAETLSAGRTPAEHWDVVQAAIDLEHEASCAPGGARTI